MEEVGAVAEQGDERDEGRDGKKKKNRSKKPKSNPETELDTDNRNS